MNTEERVIEAMGKGLSAEKAALALGISPSTISSILSSELVSSKIQEARFTNLQKHNAQDDLADRVEQKVLKRLDETIAMEFNPVKLAGIYARVNSAKRRGQSAPESLLSSKETVSIRLPQVTINNFTTNIQNQVVQVGSQELVTIQSGSLLKQVSAQGVTNERAVPALAEGQGESSRATPAVASFSEAE